MSRSKVDFLIKELDIWTDNLIKLFFIVLLLIGSYISYDMWYVYHQSSKDVVNDYKPEEITEESLKAISEKVVAWITIDDTNIDYPVLQGKDNVEYLNKNPFGEYSLSGSIFLDSRNQKDFSDDYNIIYGHHMTNGYMFGALDYFKKESYFNQHREGTLTVGNQKYHLHIIGILITDAGVDAVFDTDYSGKTPRIDVLKKEALLWDDSKKGTLVALTTCKEPLTTSRTALICRMYSDNRKGKNKSQSH